MNSETFFAQVERLRSQWPSGYGKERERALFQAFREVDDGVFVEAVTDLLYAHKGGAPVGPEIERAIEFARAKAKEREFRRGHASLLGVLEKAAENTTATREHVDACLRLLRGKLEGRYSREQFGQGVHVLEQACGIRPMPMSEIRRSRRDEAAGETGD